MYRQRISADFVRVQAEAGLHQARAKITARPVNPDCHSMGVDNCTSPLHSNSQLVLVEMHEYNSHSSSSLFITAVTVISHQGTLQGGGARQQGGTQPLAAEAGAEATNEHWSVGVV